MLHLLHTKSTDLNSKEVTMLPKTSMKKLKQVQIFLEFLALMSHYKATRMEFPWRLSKFKLLWITNCSFVPKHQAIIKCKLKTSRKYTEPDASKKNLCIAFMFGKHHLSIQASALSSNIIHINN